MSTFVQREERKTVNLPARLLTERGWSDVVVKPVISATAWGMHRVLRSDVDRVGRELGDVVAGEYLVQPFLLGEFLDLGRTGNYERPDSGSNLFSLGNFSRCPQIREPAISARTDERHVNRRA